MPAMRETGSRAVPVAASVFGLQCTAPAVDAYC